jgi:hypothetical protein
MGERACLGNLLISIYHTLLNMLDSGNFSHLLSLSDYLLSFSEYLRYWQSILDSFNFKLLKCLVDTIPAGVLLFDSIIYGEIKYLEPIIKSIKTDINKEKIRELCFNKSNTNISLCPIYRNIENSIDKELFKSPLLTENDILDSYSIAKAITSGQDSLSQGIRNLIGWDLLNYLKTSVEQIEIRNRLGFCDKHALRLVLINNLNKIINNRNLIFSVDDFSRTRTSEGTKLLVNLFKNATHTDDFKPQQLNRQILDENYNYSGLVINNKINPIWRLIKEEGICRFQQTQFWETVAVQFLTLTLVSLIELKNYPILSFLTFIAIIIIIWNHLFEKGSVHDWFTHKFYRFSAIIILWLGSFFVSYLYIN